MTRRASPAGHNGGPPITADGIVDFPDNMPKMHYFMCDIAALRKAILDKPLDVRGAYLSVLLALYEHMEPLPLDDRTAMIRCGITDTRVWNRIKRTFIEYGWLHQRPSGRLSNTRFEVEITAYVTEFRNRSKAGREREEKARSGRSQNTQNTPRMNGVNGPAGGDLASSYGLASPQLASSYGLAKPQLIASETKNTNEINDRGTSIEAERGPESAPHIRDRDREEKKERENSPPMEYVAARDGRAGLPPEWAYGLNEATAHIVGEVARMANTLAPDYLAARKQIAEALAIYGEIAVRDGFAELKAAIADGKVRIMTYKSLYGYFKQARDRGSSAAVSAGATRLPRNWKLPAAWGRWAAESFVVQRDQILAEAEKFRDHYLALAGAQGERLDWEPVWRNWFRKTGHQPRGPAGASVSDGPAPDPAKELADIRAEFARGRALMEGA